MGLIVLLNIIPLQLQQPLPESNPIDRARVDLAERDRHRRATHRGVSPRFNAEACDGDPDPKARGPQEKPHCGADQARWWEWRRTRPEPTRPATICRPDGRSIARGQWLRGRVGDNDEKEQWSRHALPCSNAHLTIGLRAHNLRLFAQ
jgi:hypothetical protein